MPYVTGEFRPSEKGICGVDRTASLAVGLSMIFRLEKETYRFMTPLSVRCIGVESAIQEWSGGAVKVSAGEGSGIEVTSVGEVFANDVENVCRDEVGARESHASPQGRGRG